MPKTFTIESYRGAIDLFEKKLNTAKGDIATANSIDQIDETINKLNHLKEEHSRLWSFASQKAMDALKGDEDAKTYVAESDRIEEKSVEIDLLIREAQKKKDILEAQNKPIETYDAARQTLAKLIEEIFKQLEEAQQAGEAEKVSELEQRANELRVLWFVVERAGVDAAAIDELKTQMANLSAQVEGKKDENGEGPLAWFRNLVSRGSKDQLSDEEKKEKLTRQSILDRIRTSSARTGVVDILPWRRAVQHAKNVLRRGAERGLSMDASKTEPGKEADNAMEAMRILVGKANEFEDNAGTYVVDSVKVRKLMSVFRRIVDGGSISNLDKDAKRAYGSYIYFAKRKKLLSIDKLDTDNKKLALGKEEDYGSDPTVLEAKFEELSDDEKNGVKAFFKAIEFALVEKFGKDEAILQEEGEAKGVYDQIIEKLKSKGVIEGLTNDQVEAIQAGDDDVAVKLVGDLKDPTKLSEYLNNTSRVTFIQAIKNLRDKGDIDGLKFVLEAVEKDLPPKRTVAEEEEEEEVKSFDQLMTEVLTKVGVKQDEVDKTTQTVGERIYSRYINRDKEIDFSSFSFDDVKSAMLQVLKFAKDKKAVGDEVGAKEVLEKVLSYSHF